MLCVAWCRSLQSWGGGQAGGLLGKRGGTSADISDAFLWAFNLSKRRAAND